VGYIYYLQEDFAEIEQKQQQQQQQQKEEEETLERQHQPGDVSILPQTKTHANYHMQRRYKPSVNRAIIESTSMVSSDGSSSEIESLRSILDRIQETEITHPHNISPVVTEVWEKTPECKPSPVADTRRGEQAGKLPNKNNTKQKPALSSADQFHKAIRISVSKWKLRKIDQLSFFFMMTGYTAFIISMFLSLPLWDNQEADAFISDEY